MTLAISPGCATLVPAPFPYRLLTRVQAAVQAALDERRLVGAVVLAVRDGEPVHGQAAGLADRESARPMRLDTVFRLASVSKPIVSTAAMVLVAQGRLDLDRGIERWLPEFQPRLADGRPARITARQLLGHSAGLGYRLPGTAWGYSVATDVLGALIERVHGAPLGEAVRQLVTGPLGMADTDFVARDAQRVATAYVNDAPQPHRLAEGETVSAFEGTVGIAYSPARTLDPHAYPSGGAGMAGTAADFMRLLEALRRGGGTLVPSALIAEMARDQTNGYELPDAPGVGFGLGFSVLRDPGLAASPESAGTWRWGGAYGHSWFVDRAQGLSVVAFTNTLYEGMSGRFVTDLRDAVYASFEAAR